MRDTTLQERITQASKHAPQQSITDWKSEVATKLHL